jgi:DHA2 family lincomycin resistance protein-like MFS transporter
MSTSATPRERSRSQDRLKPGDGLVIGLLMASTFLVLLNEMLLTSASHRQPVNG